MFVPGKTPAEIVNRLAALLQAVVRDAATGKRLADLGVEPLESTPESAAQYLERERLQWAEVIKAAGIRPD